MVSYGVQVRNSSPALCLFFNPSEERERIALSSLVHMLITPRKIENAQFGKFSGQNRDSETKVRQIRQVPGLTTQN